MEQREEQVSLSHRRFEPAQTRPSLDAGDA